MPMRVTTENVLDEGKLAMPEGMRRQMGISAGDLLYAHLETTEGAQRLMLTPAKPLKHKGRIITDPLTGWPVLDFGQDARELTNEQVLKMLADFP